MFKKYTMIALGMVLMGGEASGMSYLRRLWAPSALATASVLAAKKSSLCEDRTRMSNSSIKIGVFSKPIDSIGFDLADDDILVFRKIWDSKKEFITKDYEGSGELVSSVGNGYKRPIYE